MPRHALAALLALALASASSDQLEWKLPRDRAELHKMSTQLKAEALEHGGKLKAEALEHGGKLKEKLGYIGSNFLGGAKKLAQGLATAAVPIGPLPNPTNMIKEHTAMAEWWCATPNHSETYACRKKAFAERLRSAPSTAERQKLLKEQPKKPTDAAGQRQAVGEVQTMMRQYCTKVAAAQETALCKTSRSQDVLKRGSLGALLAGLVNSTRHKINGMSSTHGFHAPSAKPQPPRVTSGGRTKPAPAAPKGLGTESHA